jgi:hypothetical protein
MYWIGIKFHVKTLLHFKLFSATSTTTISGRIKGELNVADTLK